MYMYDLIVNGPTTCNLLFKILTRISMINYPFQFNRANMPCKLCKTSIDSMVKFPLISIYYEVWQTDIILKDDKNNEKFMGQLEDQKTLIISIKSCMCIICLHGILELAKRTCKIEGNFFFFKLTTMFTYSLEFITCSYMCIPYYHYVLCYFLSLLCVCSITCIILDKIISF